MRPLTVCHFRRWVGTGKKYMQITTRQALSYKGYVAQWYRLENGFADISWVDENGVEHRQWVPSDELVITEMAMLV